MPRLGLEVAILLAPRLAPGTPVEEVRRLADRVAMLCWERLRKDAETSELLRCWKCGTETTPKARVRVVVCYNCSLPEPGSDG